MYHAIQTGKRCTSTLVLMRVQLLLRQYIPTALLLLAFAIDVSDTVAGQKKILTSHEKDTMTGWTVVELF
jgi:hypothetical protein